VDAGAGREDAGAPDGSGGCVGDDAGEVPDAGLVPDANVPEDAGGLDAGILEDAGSRDGGSPDASAGCPAEMVEMGTFCVDRYEASHDDATSSSLGSSSTPASRSGVMPWWPVGTSEARAACSLAGKRLCTPAEWQGVCEGPSKSAYSYGNAYGADTCNGIDAFCDCGAAACSAVAPCPYPHCYNQTAPSGGGPCGASFHVVPTGSFPSCKSSAGVYDLNGNVWEIVDSSDGTDHCRGGAYNCSDSESFHRCDFEPSFVPPARGFRCCRDNP
jgi:formylglycine-generating enzyme